MVPMASSIAMSFACALGQACWRSTKAQPALRSNAAELMTMPNAGRSRGPNLGSATRQRLAHTILEAGVDGLPRLVLGSTSRIDGRWPRWRLLS
eukprot:5167255-Alexandrium_andersonii.AAC.1